MAINSQIETLEVRLAEELEERTEFCDWVSLCYTCCGNSAPTSTCTTNPSAPGSCSTGSGSTVCGGSSTVWGHTTP
jgi:hypothetical protein